jgi:hypothetical protein
VTREIEEKQGKSQFIRDEKSDAGLLENACFFEPWYAFYVMFLMQYI